MNINQYKINYKYYAKFTPLDKDKYSFPDQNQSSPIIESLQEGIQELEYLKSVANTFSAEIVENSSYIYRAGRLSKSKFFTLLKKINTSPYGEKVNPYLDRFNLDMARVLFILAIILLILTHMNYNRNVEIIMWMWLHVKLLRASRENVAGSEDMVSYLLPCYSAHQGHLLM